MTSMTQFVVCVFSYLFEWTINRFLLPRVRSLLSQAAGVFILISSIIRRSIQNSIEQFTHNIKGLKHKIQSHKYCTRRKNFLMQQLARWPRNFQLKEGIPKYSRSSDSLGCDSVKFACVNRMAALAGLNVAVERQSRANALNIRDSC
jgi:hypothetical protein